MGGGGVKQFNPFSSEGTLGRAVLTGGMSVLPEIVAKKALDMTKPVDPGAPVALPTPPNSDDPAVAAAQAEQRRARGRSSTILTAPGGNGTSSSGLIARRTLLGT